MSQKRKKGARLAAGSAVAAALLATTFAGVAWAATVDCQPEAILCEGTDEADIINGTEERDNAIGGRGGDDALYGNGGEDYLNGGKGDDRVYGGDDILSYEDPGTTGTTADPATTLSRTRRATTPWPRVGRGTTT